MYYYKQVKSSKIVSVEAKSVDVASPEFIEATKAEYDAFIASLPVVVDIITPKREAAKARAIQAINDNAAASPWGKILNDMAIAEGWIQPL